MRFVARVPRALVPIAATIASLALAGGVHAESFVAASVGHADWKDVDCGSGSDCDRKDSSWTVRGGWQVAPWLGIEGRYFDLGKAHLGPPAGAGIFGASDYSAKGFGIDAVVSWFVNQRMSLSAMAGVARSEAKTRIAGTSFVDASSGSVITTPELQITHRGTKPYYGVAAAFGVTPQLWVSLEAERYKVDFGGPSASSTDVIAAGITYRFR